MHISIRKMTEGDFESLYGLLSDPRVMEYLEPPYTREKAWQFLATAGLSDPPLIYSVEHEGNFAGYVIYHDYDDSGVEIGWVLRPEYWRKGLASRLTEQLIQRGLSSNRQLVIECSPKQEITRHIARKYGFNYEGNVDGLDVFRLKK